MKHFDYFACDKSLCRYRTQTLYCHQTMLAEKDDHVLFDLICQGDQRAFSVLFDRHWKRLYHAAYRVLEDETVAKDVVQDVLISLWEKGRDRNILNIQAYLYQAVKLQCFMHLRSGAISKKHLEHINLVATTNETEEALHAAELQSVLEEGMDTLTEKCREIFYLSRFELLPNKKIAEQLHISPKTVENQITKALRMLRLSIDKLVMITALLIDNF